MDPLVNKMCKLNQILQHVLLSIAQDTIFTYYCWFKVHKHSTRDMFSCTGLTEERVKGIITSTNGFITWHGTIGLDAMLQAVELPACIANLHTSLTNMDWDALTLCGEKKLDHSAETAVSLFRKHWAHSLNSHTAKLLKHWPYCLGVRGIWHKIQQNTKASFSHHPPPPRKTLLDIVIFTNSFLLVVPILRQEKSDQLFQILQPTPLHNKHWIFRTTDDYTCHWPKWPEKHHPRTPAPGATQAQPPEGAKPPARSRAILFNIHKIRKNILLITLGNFAIL